MTSPTTTLPPISHLLRLSPSSAHASLPSSQSYPSESQTSLPVLNLSPASPISPCSETKSSAYFHPRHHLASPLLSPSDSLSSRSWSLHPPSPLPAGALSPMSDLGPTDDSYSLPPLQGHDPPRRLVRMPSPCATPSMFNTLPVWATGSLHGAPDTLSAAPSPSTSNSSLASDDPRTPPSTSRASSPTVSTPSHSRANSAEQQLTCTTGQPVIKRRRGRPPSSREPSWDGGWTFLTPTVWDVNSHQPTTEHQLTATTTLVDPNSADGSMRAFTNSNLDTVLQMPRKKRGRKPKTHIVGNSCFVWKELTATRSTKPKVTKRNPLPHASMSSPAPSQDVPRTNTC